MSHIPQRFSRRRTLWLIGSLAGGVGLHGCTQSVTSSSSSPQSQPLVSGVNPWPGYSGHYVALQKGFF